MRFLSAERAYKSHLKYTYTSQGKVNSQLKISNHLKNRSTSKVDGNNERQNKLLLKQDTS